MSINISTHLGKYQPEVATAVDTLHTRDILNRLWHKDHTIWREDPTEISNRLGWLDSPQAMLAHADDLTQFAAGLRAEGYTDVLLLGMGGSSMAPELFSFVFGPSHEGLNLSILDTTDPDAIAALTARLNPATTLFIVATKSGSTVETDSFFKHFYNVTSTAVGETNAGAHFVAITDPGSKLLTLAQTYNFRRAFINDPNIGGRYSVLSHFGLLPAALVGVDVTELLHRTGAIITTPVWSVELGATLGALAQAGRDKLTFFLPPSIASFGDWVEQLIAESVGKEGKGILPVVGEPYGSAATYGNDRLFVHFQVGDDPANPALIAELQAEGHPVIQVELADIYDLGGQFLLWELVTAVAGHLLHIQPFDQPNVEAAKIAARQMVRQYEETGELPQGEAVAVDTAVLANFLTDLPAGAYIALQAYITPTAETTAALQSLQKQLRDKYHTAVTIGYGPRFLHSTGQLHKGDAGNGYFIQFISDPAQDLPIPDKAGSDESSISFGVLIRAQALGDGQALQDAGRPLLRFHLATADHPAQIRALLA
jgi:glucose-6-phosphate isomerase